MLLKINSVFLLVTIAIFQIANCHNLEFNSQFANPQVVPENNFVCWSPLVRQLSYHWNPEIIDQFTLLALKQRDVSWLQWLGLDETQAQQLFARIQEIPVFVPTMTPPPAPPASLVSQPVLVEQPLVFQPPQMLYTWYNQNGERHLTQETQFPALEIGSTGVHSASWNNADPNLQLNSQMNQGSVPHVNYNYASNLKPQVNFNSGYHSNLASKTNGEQPARFSFGSGPKSNVPASSQFSFNYNVKNEPKSVAGSGSADPHLNLNFGLSPQLNTNTASYSTKSDTKLNIDRTGTKSTDAKLDLSYNSPSSSDTKQIVSTAFGFGSDSNADALNTLTESSVSDSKSIVEDLSAESNTDVSEPSLFLDSVADLSVSTPVSSDSEYSITATDALNGQVDPKNGVSGSQSGSASLGAQFDTSKGSHIGWGAKEQLSSKIGKSHGFNVKFGSDASSETVGSGSSKHFDIQFSGTDASGNLKAEQGLSTDPKVKFGSTVSSSLDRSNIEVDSKTVDLNAKKSLSGSTGFGLSTNSDFQSDTSAELKQSTQTICPTSINAASAAEATDMLETATNAGRSGLSGSKSLTASVHLENQKQGHLNSGLDVLQNFANKVKSKMGELSFASHRNLTLDLGKKASPKSEVEIIDKPINSAELDVKQDGSENVETNSNTKFGSGFDKSVKIETGSTGFKFSGSRNFELGKNAGAGDAGVQASSGFKLQLPSVFSTKNRTESPDESSGSGSESGFGYNRKISFGFGRV